MGDFYQLGVISTFHRLGKIDIDKLESQLKKFSRVRPIARPSSPFYRFRGGSDEDHPEYSKGCKISK